MKTAESGQKKANRWHGALMALILLAGNLLFFLTIWLASKYDKVTLDQFIYQMKSSAVAGFIPIERLICTMPRAGVKKSSEGR